MNLNKKRLIIVGLLIAGITLVIALNWKKQSVESNAAETGCGGKTTAKECRSSCSPYKGKEKISYGCRWANSGKCMETSQPCAGLQQGQITTCPVGAACHASPIPHSYPCILIQTNNTQHKTANCCQLGMKFDSKNPEKGCVIPMQP